VIYTDLAIMAGVATRCEQCDGRRFTPDVLRHHLHGLAIDEVLRLDVAAAAQVFTTAKPAAILERLTSVGLSYITLGQPLTTLSGGERQRLKVATNMTTSAATYVLDEPSSGLHLADTDTLVMMLDQLVDNGRSVIVIEHNLAVISQADWIIDIGPGAGHDGGTITFTGTPPDMIANSTTLTANHLRNHILQ